MRWICLIAALCVAETASAQAVSPRPAPIAEVMLVGVYHMHNPGADDFNIPADDVLAERRQAEIAAVTARLAEWKPDVVMVEWTRDDAARLADLYRTYRGGDGRESRNEIMQIGFRLADRLGHARVAPIDVSTPFVSEQQSNLEAQPGARLSKLREETQAYGQGVVARQTERLKALSIGDYLAYLNTPEALGENHDYYWRHLIRMWQDENQGGAHTIANWYERNILISQNILREVEESDGKVRRVVVLFGYGHVPTLSQFVKDSPWLSLVSPLPYLRER